MTVLDMLQTPWRSTDAQPAPSPYGSEETDPRTTAETESDEGKNQTRQSADDGSVVEVEAVLKETKQLRSNKQTPSSPPSCVAKTKNKIHNVRQLSGKIVNDTRSQFVIILLIAINAIMLGIATYPFVKDNPQTSHRFEVTDMVFLIIFTVELGMQFIYRGFHLFLDGWLIFDFVIIVTSWSFSEVQIIRAFRIFRAFRLVTRVKVLQNLVTALFSVVPRMGAIGLLLILIFFIFAILMTSMWKDLYENGETEQDYFSRLDATLFTLFQVMTLDEWAGITRQVMAVQSWAWFPMITFVVITAFIVINLIIAVICDAIAALHADQKAMIHGERFDEHDDDGIDEPPDVDVKKQLQSLEQQVEELSRMQEQTMHSLQYLTRHLQAKKIS